MMSALDRKEAIRKYKERKPQRGIYAVRCHATSQVWVGSSPNLDAARNSCWFSLRHNGHPNHGLQAVWSSQPEETFAFEILEVLDEDISPLVLRDTLEERRREWLGKLGAVNL